MQDLNESLGNSNIFAEAPPQKFQVFVSSWKGGSPLFGRIPARTDGCISEQVTSANGCFLAMMVDPKKQ